MTFIVTLIALLIERFFDWSHLRRWSWYGAFERMIAKKLSGSSPYLILFLTVVPLLFGVGIVAFLLKGALYGFLSLIFELIVLLYCLGPQNLWADSFACINPATSDQITKLFHVEESNDRQKLHKQLLSSIFIEANRRVFAVIFWFAILGPIGAFLYRTITLSAQEKEIGPADVMKSARTIEMILDWLPVRIFTFIFALGGHFAEVLSSWRKHISNGLTENEMILTECGEAALAGNEKTIPEDGSAEKNAINLLDRAFVIVLVIVAIVVLLT